MRSVRGRNKNLTKRRSGYVFVEFAIVFCLFLMPLTMALLQYGDILRTTLGLNNVSREVGRFAAVYGRRRSDDPTGSNPTTNTDLSIRNYAVAQARGMRIRINDPQNDILLSPAQNTSTQPNNRQLYGNITVTITYDMSSRLFLPAKFMGIPIFNRNYVTTVVMPIQ